MYAVMKGIWPRLTCPGVAASLTSLLVACSASLAVAQGPDVPESGPAQPNLPRTYWNKNVILLPIRVEERGRQQIREIQLYVKGPGAWQKHARANAGQASFTYQPPQDGEYWFGMVTVDQQGRQSPQDITHEPPGLVVVFDRQAPKVELQNLGMESEGHMLQCDFGDEHLDTLKSRVCYQTGDRVFRTMEAVPGKPNVFCIPTQAVFTGIVRATAIDLAGNVTQRDYNLAQMPVTAGKTIAQAQVPPQQVTQPQVAVTPPTLPMQPTPHVTPAQASVPDTAPMTGPMVASKTTTTTLLPETKPGRFNAEPEGEVEPGPTVEVPGQEVVKATPAEKVTPVVQRVHRVGPAITNGTVNPETTLPQVTIPTETHPVPPGTPCATGTTAVPHRDVVSLQRQLVNNPHVYLDYQIEQTGASGVGKVEVWITRDQGQSWQCLCEDADRKSPAEIDLPGEGLFGVSLVVGNGRGFGATPPNPGDTPQWWIEVDMTKPAAEIASIRTIPDGGGILHINWRATDKNLAADGIDLYYAASRQGPWQVVAKGLRNDGLYRWTPPAEAGAQAYVRLVAHDQAGNTVMTETAQPVLLDDQSRPRGQILGISNTPTKTPQGN